MIRITTLDEGLLLALLNTTPTVAGAQIDQLADPDLARAWLQEQAGESPSGEDLELLRQTRDSLQALVHDETTTPAALAPAMADVTCRASIGDDGITWDLAIPPPQALSARAVLAWDSLRRSAPGRLRPCANTEECTLFLIDHSKSNSARWCSMSGCGNRMKARRHYERRKGTSTAR